MDTSTDTTYAQAACLALSQAMRDDRRIVVLGEDVGRGGIFGQYAGLQQEFGAQRVIDTPISEATIMGAGVGMALAGLKPVVEMRVVDFALCAMDEIVNQAAKNRFMFGGQGRVPLVARLPIGMWAFARLPHRAAMMSLGIFITLVGLRNLLAIAPDMRAPRWLAKALLVVGGIVHGAFTTGGPLLIVYADQTLRRKSVFRVTLSLMWLALNALLAIAWTARHEWTAASVRLSLLGLPFMFLGLIAGERLHHRVSEASFRRAVNLTLVVMGLTLILIPAA